jgi:hypothetical protein
VTDGSVTTTATLAGLARRRACPPLTLTALLGDHDDREDSNEPGEQGESSHGGLQTSIHVCILQDAIVAFTITNVQSETRH